MRKPLLAPRDPATEFARDDIVKIAKCSAGKIIKLTQLSKYGFPRSHRHGPKKLALYPRAAVEKWLQNNDIKSIVIPVKAFSSVGGASRPISESNRTS